MFSVVSINVLADYLKTKEEEEKINGMEDKEGEKETEFFKTEYVDNEPEIKETCFFN